MDWLRCKVSGKRNRYKDEDYNLDITYITGRNFIHIKIQYHHLNTSALHVFYS